MKKPSLDFYKGCMLGGAMGDALGYPVEFWSGSEIRRTMGPEGVTPYYGEARISDDTQMSLFTAAGLLSAEPDKDGYFHYRECLWEAYQDWFRTQVKPGPEAVLDGHSWLMREPRLYARRAPGNTCMGALEGGRPGSVKNPLNDSKGCGGIMRAAPVALYALSRGLKELYADMLGATCAVVTHGHELGYMPAAALVQAILKLGQGYDMRTAVLSAIDAVTTLFPDTLNSEVLDSLTSDALRLAKRRDSRSDREVIETELGGGWVAEETWAIAVYCAVRYEGDFSKALTVSVSHSGDSDSTGAVTGNLMGARTGYEAIPEIFKRGLELHEVVEQVAEDLYRAGEDHKDDPDWQRRYLFAGKGWQF